MVVSTGCCDLCSNGQTISPRIRIFNAEIQSHGWESKYTTLVILCRGVPFTTASVRGELNRRNLRIHTIASSNLAVSRDGEGNLEQVLSSENGDSVEHPEALLFFEIGRHSNPDELTELRDTLAEILAEVTVVVDDFPTMCERLHDARTAIGASECVTPDYRDEAAAFLEWMEQDHMTLLGYEYLQVKRSGKSTRIKVNKKASLGLLRQRESRGVADLQADLQNMSLEQLHKKQLSFSKSQVRSRVHRLTYPDYVTVKDFDEDGELMGQHRIIGLYTSSVYTMNPRLIPILRRKVEQILALSNMEWAAHESRELARVVEVFPRDELFQSSVQDLYDTVNTVNRIQERRQTRLFVRKDVHGKFVNCIVYIPRDRYNTEQREKIEAILTAAFHAEESEFTTHFSESILVRCHFVLRVDPAVPLEFDAARSRTRSCRPLWPGRIGCACAWWRSLAKSMESSMCAIWGRAFPRATAMISIPGWRCWISRKYCS